MPTKREKKLNAAFMDAWAEFGDHKSTEFLVQIVADRHGADATDVYDALAACSDEVATHE